MSVESAIHEHWRTYKPLTDLVPWERIMTGWVPSEDENELPLGLPFISLVRPGTSASQRASGGKVYDRVLMQFSIWADSLPSLKDITSEILTHFNRADFEWSGGKVLDMKQINVVETHQADDVWHGQVDYIVQAVEEVGLQVG